MAALRARTVLLTGSNRGIGLELVKQLLGGPRPPAWIFATCRDPEGPRAQVSAWPAKGQAKGHGGWDTLRVGLGSGLAPWAEVRWVEVKVVENPPVPRGAVGTSGCRAA